MGVLSTAAGARPAFFERPHITDDARLAGQIVVSSGDAFLARAYDMSRNTQWTTVGEDTDGVAATYDAKVYVGSTHTAKDADCLLLLNHNLKRFKVEYSKDGGAWTVFPGTDYTAADYGGGDLIVSLDAAISADRWRLTATHTQDADEEKAVGALLPCKLQFQASRGLTEDFVGTPKDQVVTVELADGSLDETRFLHNDADSGFLRTPLTFLAVPLAELDSFEDLQSEFFLFHPEPGDRTGLAYYGRVRPNSYNARYMPGVPRSKQLYRVSFQFEEAGGL